MVKKIVKFVEKLSKKGLKDVLKVVHTLHLFQKSSWVVDRGWQESAEVGKDWQDSKEVGGHWEGSGGVGERWEVSAGGHRSRFQRSAEVCNDQAGVQGVSRCRRHQQVLGAIGQHDTFVIHLYQYVCRQTNSCAWAVRFTDSIGFKNFHTTHPFSHAEVDINIQIQLLRVYL